MLPTTSVAVLGSTGSIGTSTLDVIRHAGGRLAAVALTAGRNHELLAQQAAEFRPRRVCLAEIQSRDDLPTAAFGTAEVLFGSQGVEQIAADGESQVVIAGIAGAAGLRGTWAAIEAGKTVGLANKETMVVAGPLVNALAARRGATLIPVDSEHSAIHQALQCGKQSEVKRVVLTASGGPFRGKKRSELASVTPAQALAHPTWAMGKKITIDSATMMNKALEIIEAKWLFGLRDDQLAVVVHPQSIVHSFVEFVDGSVIAQLSPPDMRLPIQHVLTWPDRVPGPARTFDWSQHWSLTFEPPDEEAFPALALGRECAARGGSCGAVLNAAGEVAVERFLAGEIGFLEIPGTCRGVLDAHDYDPAPSLSDLFRLDAWARQEATRWRA